MPQRKIGNVLVLFGLVVMALGVTANQATATDQGNYQDKVTSIEGSRSYDGTNTTFVFKAEFEEPVSHIVVVSCPEGINVVDASGPPGVTVEKNKTDPGGTDHTGAKFEKADGTPSGTYTVVFSGNVTGAGFIVKNGNGHKHNTIGTGTGCGNNPVTTSSTEAPPTADTATTTTTAPTTTTTAPTTTTTAPTTTTTLPAETTTTTAPAETTTTTAPAETTTTTAPAETTTTTTAPAETTTTTAPASTTTTLLPDILGETTTTTEAPSSSSSSSSSTTATTAAPSSTTSSTVDSSVLGSQLENPSQPLLPAPSVEGTTETANIPATGTNTGDYLLLAGLALLLGGLAVRFGQPDGAIQR